jgi:putative nucleotidyltransferase with HDIG domain
MNLMTRKLLHNLNALADLGSHVSSDDEFEDVIRASLYTLLGSLAIPKGAVARFSSKPPSLKVIAAKGLPRVGGEKIAVTEEEAARLALRPKPFSLEDGRNGLARLGVCVAVPMAARGELMGLVLLSEKLSKQQMNDEDLALVTTFARHIGIAIHNHRLVVSLRRKAEENRRLYREMRELYQNTIRAFAAAIDLKDAYTKGHSDRVARYAEAIAREMGVTGQELEQISVAGYLHDIGKIVVDRAIINNPRPLTDREHRELNKHVTTGYEILSNISRPWKEIAYLTKCHHEKMDGTGYPQGLSGEQIPLGARIVTVADSYDAMITDRPYRSRLPLEQALAELQRNTGRQFAPEVVSAFCRRLLKEITREAKERVLTSAVDRRYDQSAVISLLYSMIAQFEVKKRATSGRGQT